MQKFTIGAHVSIVGGYISAIEKIVHMGGNCLQIFSSAPQGWRFAQVSEKEINTFKQAKKIYSIHPVYFHASYLINFADTGRIGQLSKQSLIHELHIAEKLGITGSIIHLGSFKQKENDYRILGKNIQEVLDATSAKTYFIIENAGNRKIGQSMDQIATIVRHVDSDRIRVCLDTCHLHATGYNLSTQEKLDDFLNMFDEKIGIQKLEVFHMNDSRDEFHSFHDRHENIGEGKVGINVFKNILNHPRLKHLPFIIETPGFDNRGPDEKNLQILKSFIYPS